MKKSFLHLLRFSGKKIPNVSKFETLQDLKKIHLIHIYLCYTESCHLQKLTKYLNCFSITLYSPHSPCFHVVWMPDAPPSSSTRQKCIFCKAMSIIHPSQYLAAQGKSTRLPYRKQHVALQKTESFSKPAKMKNGDTNNSFHMALHWYVNTALCFH